MCDTFVALPDATADGGVLLAKNSDREPNEAHDLVFVPAREHGEGASLACTYVTIPQVERTHAVLLGKPFWIWGAEMGANEHGVVIGNEAVFTKVAHEKEPGLIGMDLLRLGLERADTAEGAVTVIADLLEQYGQGGDCGYTHEFRYHNSFLLADPGQAWILETAGRQWAARRVHRSASISNAITIAGDVDRSSAGLVDHAVARKWCAAPEDFDFGAAYSDRIYTRFSDARVRQCRTNEALAARRGHLDVPAMWELLADHGQRSEGRNQWGPADHPGAGLFGQTVCAHAGYGPVRVSQTTGSWVSHLPAPAATEDPAAGRREASSGRAAQGSPQAGSPVPPGRPATHWVTGTAAPCLSVRKPVWFDAAEAAGLPAYGPRPGGTYRPGALWWDHEDLHRTVLLDYPRLRGLVEPDRRDVQARIDDAAARAVGGSVADRVDCTRLAFELSAEAERRWLETVRRAAPATGGPSLYRRAWRGFDRAAGRSPA